VHPALAATFDKDALAMALGGGEDYELCFTAAPPDIMRRIMKRSPLPVAVIGHINAENSGRITLIDQNDKPLSSDYQGWQHFAPNQP
jgi:thiamine-monophosphate kinase